MKDLGLFMTNDWNIGLRIDAPFSRFVFKEKLWLALWEDAHYSPKEIKQICQLCASECDYIKQIYGFAWTLIFIRIHRNRCIQVCINVCACVLRQLWVWWTIRIICMTQQGYEILKSLSMNPSSKSALVEEEEEEEGAL